MVSFFLFVFPDTMWGDFNAFMINKYGDQYSPLVVRLILAGDNPLMGIADIERGMGFVEEDPNSPRRELYHLQSCSVHKQSPDEEPTTWVKHENAEQYHWSQN